MVGFIKPLVTEGEDILREFVQSLFNDFKAAGTTALASAAASALHA